MIAASVSARLLQAALVVSFLALGLTGSDWGLPGPERAEILEIRPGPYLDVVKAVCRRDLETKRELGLGKAIPVDPRADDGILARIDRRFLLYTHHPDEGKLFSALSNIRPEEGRIAPGTYAYGGLFFYPLGGWYWIASQAGLCALVPDAGFYLDRPEEMGRLVRLGRIWVVLAGAFAIPVLFRIGSLLGGTAGGAVLAGLWTFHPMVTIAAHEIKPYLPAAAFSAACLLYALRSLRGEKGRNIAKSAVCAGLAAGVAPTAYPLAILPVGAALAAAGGWPRRFRAAAGAGLLAAAVFLLCNPTLPFSWDVIRREAATLNGEHGSFPADAASYAGFFLSSLPLGLHPLLLPFLAAGALLAARRPGGLFLPAVLALLLAHFLVFSGQQIRQMAMIRFLLPYLPIALVLVAEGILSAARAFPRAGRAVPALAAVLVAGTTLTAVDLYRTDRGATSTRLAAGRWIRENVPAGELAIPTGPAPWDFPPLPFRRYAAAGMVWGTPHCVATTERAYLVRVVVNESLVPTDPAFELAREWDVRGRYPLGALLPRYVFWAQPPVRLYKRKGA